MGLKYYCDESFFDTWSVEMAYVLGYLYADGSIDDVSYNRGKYMRVTSTDVDRIDLIRKLLSSKHTILKEVRGGNRKPKYVLQIGSHRLYEALTRLGVTPHKSLTMKLPVVPHKFFGSFVCGYFDGDGCAYIERRKLASGRIGYGRLTIIFTSGSKDFLASLHDTFREHEVVRGNGLYKHSNGSAHQLRYLTQDSLRLFSMMYGGREMKDLYLKRKYAIFTQYFDAKPNVVNQSALTFGLMAK